MAVQFDRGVVVGADSRTTSGSYIVRRRSPRPLSLLTSSSRLIVSPTSSPTSTIAYIVVDRGQRQTHRPSPILSTGTANSRRASNERALTLLLTFQQTDARRSSLRGNHRGYLREIVLRKQGQLVCRDNCGWLGQRGWS